MFFKLNTNISINNKGNRYKYTIEGYELGIIGILDVCRLTNKSVREVLDLSEDEGALIESYNGHLFFKTEEEASKFMNFLEDTYKRIYNLQ